VGLREHAEMARRWSLRRRRDAPPASTPPAGDDANLADEEHAWWAQREVEELWTPRARPPASAPPEVERDILADHFGADWRTSFGFTPASEPDMDEPDGPDAPALPDLGDPYEVLEVDPSASWDEIVAAHRHQARAHHPDRLVGRSPEQVALGEERIRIINGAYQELRVRRGR
jgi:hypothetical protein